MALAVSYLRKPPVVCNHYSGPTGAVQLMQSLPVAAGLPVVGTDIGGPHEVHGARIGILTPPLGNEEALTESLIATRRDPLSATAMGKRSGRYVSENYSSDQVVAAPQHLYCSLITDGRSGLS
jgi:glycosyltransferase involved in cell wall biosynthesis